MAKSTKTTYSAGERALIEQAALLQRRRREAREKEWRATSEFMAHYHETADEYHRKVIGQAFRAAGINEAELEKRHKIERASALKFLEAARREALRHASDTDEAHRAYIGELLQRRTLFLAPAPPPAPAPATVVAMLNRATSIDLDGRGDTSIAAEQNIVHTKVERGGWVSGVQWDLRGDIAAVSWNFLWQPPRDGMLNAISALAMNGWGGAYPGPGCVKGSASWSLDAGLTLTQLGGTGAPLTDSFQNRVAEERFGSDDLPASGGVIFTGTRVDGVENLIYDKLFPVVQQTPVLVTVTAFLYALVAHGEAELNFLDRGFQLNVPYLYLLLF